MKPTTNEQLPEEREIFAECWRILRDYRRIDKTDGKAWGELYSKLSALCNKYDNATESVKKLVLDMATATITYLEKAEALPTGQKVIRLRQTA